MPATHTGLQRKTKQKKNAWTQQKQPRHVKLFSKIHISLLARPECTSSASASLSPACLFSACSRRSPGLTATAEQRTPFNLEDSRSIPGQGTNKGTQVYPCTPVGLRLLPRYNLYVILFFYKQQACVFSIFSLSATRGHCRCVFQHLPPTAMQKKKRRPRQCCSKVTQMRRNLTDLET